MKELYRVLIARIMIILTMFLMLVALVMLSLSSTATNEPTTAEITANIAETTGPKAEVETTASVEIEDENGVATEVEIIESAAEAEKTTPVKPEDVVLKHKSDVTTEIQAVKLQRQEEEASRLADEEAKKAEEAAKLAAEEAAAKLAAEEAAKKSYVTPEIYSSIEELASNCSLTVDEIIYIMKTLYGEANAVNSKAERSMVVWVILNRLDTPGYGFGNSIQEIVTKEWQFTGYLESNPVTDRSFEVVCDVILRWEAEKAGQTNVGRTIPKEILFFHSDNGHNKFYKYTEVNRGEKIYFDRDNPIENPYEN